MLKKLKLKKTYVLKKLKCKKSLSVTKILSIKNNFMLEKKVLKLPKISFVKRI